MLEAALWVELPLLLAKGFEEVEVVDWGAWKREVGVVRVCALAACRVAKTLRVWFGGERVFGREGRASVDGMLYLVSVKGLGFCLERSSDLPPGAG